MIKGYAGRVLEVDLGTQRYEFKPLDESIARQYIGGKGYGTRLLYDTTPAGIDPLGGENPLIFATGPLNGSVAPQSNRFAVVCKSPLTGGIGNRGERRPSQLSQRPQDGRVRRRHSRVREGLGRRLIQETLEPTHAD